MMTWWRWHRRQDWLLGYLEQTLPLETRRRAEEHVSTCPACRRELETLQAFNRSVQGFFQMRPQIDTMAVTHRITRHLQSSTTNKALQDYPTPWWSPATWTWRPMVLPALAAWVVIVIWGVALWQRPLSSTRVAVVRGEGKQFPSPLMGEGRVRVVTPGSTVTAHTGPITLTLPNVSLAMERGSTVTVEERGTKGAALSVHLEEGTVTASVVPGTPFTVKTALGEARAKGTEFQVQLKEIPSPQPPSSSLGTTDPLVGSPTRGEGKGREQGGAGTLPSSKVQWTLPQKGGHKMKRLMTVIVLAGIVEVQNGFGTLACAAGDTATVEEGKAPSPADPRRTLIEPDGTWGLDKVQITFNGAPYTGVKTTWHPNGQKASETPYRDGQLEGLSVSWHENGQKAWEIIHRDGKIVDGTFVTWHPNGQKASEISCRDGKSEGLYVTWHPNGQQATEVTYHNGHQEGLAVTWDENGRQTSNQTSDKPITLGAKLKTSPSIGSGQASDGLTVTAITPESPAARASLQVGDRLLTIEGQPVSKTPAAFLAQLDGYAEGSLIKLVVERKEVRISASGAPSAESPAIGRHTLLLPWTRQDALPVKASKPVERPKK